MLLLVLDPQLHQGRCIVVEVAVEEAIHPGIDVSPVLGHVSDPRAGHKTTLGTRMPGAHSVVVRVEEKPEVGVEDLIPDVGWLEQEGLEEPRCVGSMPLGRAGLGHRLHRLVFGRERGRQRLGQAPSGVEPLGKHLIDHGR